MNWTDIKLKTRNIFVVVSRTTYTLVQWEKVEVFKTDVHVRPPPVTWPHRHHVTGSTDSRHVAADKTAHVLALFMARFAAPVDLAGADPSAVEVRDFFHYIKRIHCVSKKNIPDIFDCNLKTNYQILIIYSTNVSDTTCHQTTIQFPTSPAFVFALPGENTASEISLFIQCDMIA